MFEEANRLSVLCVVLCCICEGNNTIDRWTIGTVCLNEMLTVFDSIASGTAGRPALLSITNIYSYS